MSLCKIRNGIAEFYINIASCFVGVHTKSELPRVEVRVALQLDLVFSELAEVVPCFLVCRALVPLFVSR